MTIEDDIITQLKESPKYFNELRRLLPYEHMEVYCALIRLEHDGKIKSKMIKSSFETKLRWVRQYEISK